MRTHPLGSATDLRWPMFGTIYALQKYLLSTKGKDGSLLKDLSHLVDLAELLILKNSI